MLLRIISISIRTILFFFLLILALGLIDYLFVNILLWTLKLVTKGFLFGLLVFVLFSAGLWTLFRVISSALIWFVKIVSPTKKLAFITIPIFSIINAIGLIYFAWTQKPDFSGTEIFIACAFTFLVLQLTWALIFGVFGTES